MSPAKKKKAATKSTGTKRAKVFGVYPASGIVRYLRAEHNVNLATALAINEELEMGLTDRSVLVQLYIKGNLPEVMVKHARELKRLVRKHKAATDAVAEEKKATRKTVKAPSKKSPAKKKVAKRKVAKRRSR